MNEKQRYMLGAFPYHLAQAGLSKKMILLLWDYRFLKTKLKEIGLPALLADFDLPEKGGLQISKRSQNELGKLARALQLSATALHDHPEVLPSQLAGRLLGLESLLFDKLISQIEKTEPYWLRPLTPSLRKSDSQIIRTIKNQNRPILFLVFSPDGQMLLSDWDSQINVWDIASGLLNFSLPGHIGSQHLRDLGIDPSGRFALSSANDTLIKVWDLEQRKIHLTYQGHQALVNTICPTIEGQVISGDTEGMVHSWQIYTGKCLDIYQLCDNAIHVLVYDKSRDRIIAAVNDGRILIWQRDPFSLVAEIQAHQGVVWSLDISPDCLFLISSGSDKSINLWRLENLSLEANRANLKLPPTAVKFKPDGHQAISASLDGDLRFWDLPKMTAAGNVEGHTGSINVLQFSPGGRLFTGSTDNLITEWELQKQFQKDNIPRHQKSVWAMLHDKSQGLLASFSLDRNIKVWDSTTLVEKFQKQLSERINEIAFSSDKQFLLALSESQIFVWQLADGALVNNFEVNASTSEFRKIYDVPGDKLMVENNDGISVWDFLNGELKWQIKTNKLLSKLDCFSEGSIAALGWNDGLLELWDLQRGEKLNQTRMPPGNIWNIVFSSNGKHLVTRTGKQKFVIWDVQMLSQVRSVDTGGQGIDNLIICNKGQRVISYYNNTLDVWDTSGQNIKLKGHTWIINGIIVVKLRLMISWSLDQTVIVWDYNTLEVLAVYAADAPISVVQFLEKENRLIVADFSGRLTELKIVDKIAQKHNNSFNITSRTK